MVPNDFRLLARFSDGVTLTRTKHVDFRPFRAGLPKLVEKVRRQLAHSSAYGLLPRAAADMGTD
jgi:hypothetical protein